VTKLVLLPDRSEIYKAICPMERGAKDCDGCSLDCRSSREDIITVLDTVYKSSVDLDIDTLVMEWLLTEPDNKGLTKHDLFDIPKVKFSDFIKERIGGK
jgi:hypothetical protein